MTLYFRNGTTGTLFGNSSTTALLFGKGTSGTYFPDSPYTYFGDGGGAPLGIIGTPVTTATQNTAYTGFSVTGTGGTAPYTYSVVSGALPTGITLNASSGAVSGTPTLSETQTGIVIRVTDATLTTADLAAFQILVYDEASGAYFTAMSVQPNDTRKALINTLIVDLKADGVWALLDWFCLLAAHDEQAGRLNAWNPAKALTAVNSPAFTTDRGFTGNATSSYLRTAELPNAAPNLYALNSASFGVWCNLQGATSGTARHIGVPDPTVRGVIIASDSTANETFAINDATTGVLRVGVSDRKGHRTASRTASNVKRGFVAGVNTAALTTASVAVPSTELVILRNNTSYSDDRIAAFYSGGGMSDANVSSMHTRLNTYLTVIGAD